MKPRMTLGQINAMLKNLKNIQLKLNEAAGPAVSVEVRMRLIGELHKPVRDKIKELVMNSNRKRKSNYWDCDLSFLDDALDEVFHDKLETNERKQIEGFRDLRNALLHGNFINLMILMNIPPTGRNISSEELLGSKDIKEAITSLVKNNQPLERFRTQATEVAAILDKIILSLVDS